MNNFFVKLVTFIGFLFLLAVLVFMYSAFGFGGLVVGLVILVGGFMIFAS